MSTAYANCDRYHIDEKLYEPTSVRVKPEHLIELCEWMSEDLVECLSERLVTPKPNTYTYTKALAECLVMREMAHMPCAIVRPSIIGSTWREPFPGWIDNFNGPSALFPGKEAFVFVCF